MDTKRLIWRPYFVLLTTVLATLLFAFWGNVLVRVLLAFYVEPMNFSSWGGWLTVVVLSPVVWMALKTVSPAMRKRLQPVPRRVIKTLRPGENPKLLVPEWFFLVSAITWFIGGVVGVIYGYDELFGLEKPGANLRAPVISIVLIMGPFLLVSRWLHRNAEIKPGFLMTILENNSPAETEHQNEA